jgi:nicotinamide-nucleotide amidase
VAVSHQDAGAYIYAPELERAAADVLRMAADRKLRIATAESCTGGALAALLTDVEGWSHVFERGFAVYCEEAKTESLGVSTTLLKAHGPVSAEVARAMAEGALAHSHAGVAVAITGNAGPAGPNAEEGLVHLVAADRKGRIAAAEHHFGPLGRSRVRICALKSALILLAAAVQKP